MSKISETGKLLLKTNFAIKHKWEPFYTGGSVATCEDGKMLLCACGDSVQVVDVATGAIKHTLSQEGDDVTCVISSPDNNFIVSAARSLLLKQWTVGDSSECVRTWKAIHTGPISCMDFDATSTLLASGSSDGTIKIWDMVRQYCTHNLRGSPGVISVVKFHPRDLKMFSASDDYVIRIWDLHTSRCICTLQSHVSAVTSLAFIIASDNVTLISGGRDSVLNVWDVKTIKENTKIEPKKTIPVYETIEAVLPLPQDHDVRLLPNNEGSTLAPLVVTAGSSGNLRVWDTTTGKCVYSQKKKADSDTSKADSEKASAIVDLLTLKDSGKYTTVTFDHNINIFDVQDGFVLDKHLVGYNDEILDVKFSGPNDTHIIVATNSPLIKVFDLKSSGCQLLDGHQDTVLSLDVFRGGLTFASGSKDNTVHVWQMDPSSFKVSCIAIGRGHTHAAATVACSRLKRHFLVSGGQDQTLKIWKFPDDSENSEFPENLKAKHTVKAHDKDINSVTISPNDKLVATGSQDKTAKLWNISDGNQLGTFRGHKRGIWSVQFSPTDQVLGSSSADGTVKLWSLADYSCLKTFEGHDCSVLKIIFISKGTQIMSSGSDGLLKLWNVKSSECVQTFDGHDDKVWGLAVNTADSLVLSGAADSKILQWEDVTLKEREEERKAGETVVLKQQELNNLIHEKKFAKALGLAITLNQPFTALKIVKEIRWQENGKMILEETVQKMRPDQKDTLLKFLMSWNTNSRNCHEAQNVFNLIIRSTPPHDMMTYSNAQTAVEALLPYTERHYQRVSKVLQQTTFVNYVWQLMKLKPVNLNTLKDEEETPDSKESFVIDKHPLRVNGEKEESVSEEESDSEEEIENEKRTNKDVKTENGQEEISSEDDNDADTEYETPPKKMRLRSATKSVNELHLKQVKGKRQAAS